MVGWWIIVSQQTPQERDASSREIQQSNILASWEASVGGLDWIDKLVKEGRAQKLYEGGYPNRYTALAKEVLPLLEQGIPAHDGPTITGDDYVMPGNWIGNMTFHRDRMSACEANKTLTIDAWDQS